MALRILQLSDPHLVASPYGLCHGLRPLLHLRHGLEHCLEMLRTDGELPDLLLLTGDLCHDESWGGYRLLRDLLAERWPASTPVVALPGNHDHPQLLRAALGRRSPCGSGLLRLQRPSGTAAGWSLLALDSHCSGREGGRLAPTVWRTLDHWLAAASGTGDLLVVALHHPPVAIGDAGFDAIGLEDGERLVAALAASPSVRAVVFGHIHQHWLGSLPGRPEVPLLGCPSTLRAFGPVQPCPAARPLDPGGRLLDLGDQGEIRHRLLRWHPPQAS